MNDERTTPETLGPTKIPNPGSLAAGEMGCVCPVIDNSHGRGYFGDADRFGFVVREDCPIHGTHPARGKS